MAGKKSRSQIETELKIKLSPDDLEKVLKKLRKEAVSGSFYHKYMPRYYYDTEALDLHQRGASLRVQYVSGKRGALGAYEQTFKYGLEDSGDEVLTRKEVKDEVESPLPDLTAIQDADAVKISSGIENKSLKHIFTAAIERRLFYIEKGKNTELEIAFDVGIISLSDDISKFIKINEIEIEVKKGSAKSIQEIREMIFDIAPSAEIQRQSKSEQGTIFYSKNKNINLNKP